MEDVKGALIMSSSSLISFIEVCEMCTSSTSSDFGMYLTDLKWVGVLVELVNMFTHNFSAVSFKHMFQNQNALQQFLQTTINQINVNILVLRDFGNTNVRISYSLDL